VLASTPAIPSLPSSVPCSSPSGTYHLSVGIEPLPNGTTKPVTFTVTITAKGAGGKKAIKVTAIVEAYRWHFVARPAGTTAALSAIACANPTTCVAVGKSGREVTYTSGAVTSKVVDGTFALTSVACAPGSTTLCVLGDSRGAFLTDIAGTFGAPILLNSGSPVSIASIACESPSAGHGQCLVVDTNGVAVFVSLHQGSALGVIGPDFSPTSGVTFATCEGQGLCEAADQAGLGTTTDTTTFTPAVKLVAGAHPLTGFACGAGLCIAVDHAGGATPFETNLQRCMPTGALTPSCVRQAPNTLALKSISCADWLCVAIAPGAAEQFSYADPIGFRWGSWNGPVTGSGITSNGALDAVGCVSISFTAIPGCSFLTGAAGAQKELTGHVTLLK